MDAAPFPAPSRCTPFLDRLTPAAAARVTDRSRRVSYPPGSVAFHEGDTLQTGILESGLARVFISSGHGRQATIRYLHRGELIGITLVADDPFPASLQVVSDAVIRHLDNKRFGELAAGDLEIAVALYSDMAARLVHAVHSATVLVFGSPAQKVAYDLLDRACREQLTSGRLVVAVTHQELADGINSSREVVSRALAQLRRKKIIATAVRLVRILDAERLAELVWLGVI